VFFSFNPVEMIDIPVFFITRTARMFLLVCCDYRRASFVA